MTHGEHGWHVHLHAVLALDGPVSDEMLQSVGAGMFTRWARGLGKFGATAIQDKGGLHVRGFALNGETAEQLAEYVTKAAFEIASPITKDGRSGSRSPFAILADGLSTGLADDLELWGEYEQASHNRRQLTWSLGLRDWAGLRRERTDDEIAAVDLGGVTYLMLPGETWRAVRPVAAELLNAAEIGGLAGATRWLDSRKLAWFVPKADPRRAHLWSVDRHDRAGT